MAAALLLPLGPCAACMGLCGCPVGWHCCCGAAGASCSLCRCWGAGPSAVQGAATPLLVPGQHASGASHMLLLSEATSAAGFCPTRLCFFLLCLLVCRSALPAAELTRMVAVFAANGSAQIALAMRLGGAAAGVLGQLRWLEPAGCHLRPLCSLTTVQADCTGFAGKHSAAAAAVAVGGRNRPCTCLQRHHSVFVSPWGRGEQPAGRQAAARPASAQQVAQRRWWYIVLLELRCAPRLASNSA